VLPLFGFFKAAAGAPLYGASILAGPLLSCMFGCFRLRFITPSADQDRL
jgi:hypothetical protein